MTRRILLVGIVLFAGWIATDFLMDRPHSLTTFDGRQIGRIETAMWRSYYEHRQARLFIQLAELLREQYHLPFWRSVAGAYYAAKAALVFQRGHNRQEYERALPDLESFYSNIRRGSDVAFDVHEASRLELEWWILHREHSPHLEQALSALQAELYRKPAAAFAQHAKARADAMLLRDRRGASITEEDWNEIGKLLDSSWTALETAMTRTSR